MIWIWLQGGEPGVRQGHTAHQAHRGGRVGAHQVPGDWRIFHCIWGKFPFSQLYFHKSPSGSRWLKNFSFVYAENFLFFYSIGPAFEPMKYYEAFFHYMCGKFPFFIDWVALKPIRYQEIEEFSHHIWGKFTFHSFFDFSSLRAHQVRGYWRNFSLYMGNIFRLLGCFLKRGPIRCQKIEEFFYCIWEKFPI